VSSLPVFLAGVVAGCAMAVVAGWLLERRRRRRDGAQRAALAHDLRTPLASITAYAEILQDDPSEGPRYLGIIHQEAGRMATIVDALDREPGAKAAPAATLGAVAEPESGQEPRVSRQDSGPRRVLVVDDDRYILEATRTLLNRAGFLALGAGSALEALSQARSQRPDLILMDLMMPGLRGDEVVHRLRANPETRGIPVILTTGDCTAGPMDGVSAVLTKPISRETLLEAVSRALPGGS